MDAPVRPFSVTNSCGAAKTGLKQRRQSVRSSKGIWTVTAVSVPHEPCDRLGEQVETGWTDSSGTGVSELNCFSVIEIPASTVGNGTDGARTGCVSELPIPATNSVTNCPGATVNGTGAAYPAPTTVLVWANAGSMAKAQTTLNLFIADLQ